MMIKKVTKGNDIPVIIRIKEGNLTDYNYQVEVINRNNSVIRTYKPTNTKDAGKAYPLSDDQSLRIWIETRDSNVNSIMTVRFKASLSNNELSDDNYDILRDILKLTFE